MSSTGSPLAKSLPPLEGVCSLWERPPSTSGQSLVEALSEIRGYGPSHSNPDPRKDPFFPEVEKFVGRLFDALKAGDSVFVSSDYDVDGVVSSAILCEIFRQSGIQPIPFIPDRFMDGYGVGVDAARKRFAETPFSALVTVDCGSADIERLGEFAKEFKVPVYILDHHKVPVARKLPKGLHELNPATIEGLEPTHYCTGTLAFLTACALAKRTPHLADFEDDFACLGGLAAIADVSSSMGQANRYAMRTLLSKGSTCRNHGLRALYATAQLKGEITTADIGFRIAPLINAAGRMEHAEAAFEVFDSPTHAEACDAAARLKDLNTRRKALQEAVVDEALAIYQDNPTPTMVAWSSTWHPGVVGPAAGSLAEHLNIPVFLGSAVKESNKITFSARTAQGIDLYSLAAKAANGLSMNYGGHKAAMGMRVPYNAEGEEVIVEFASRLNKIAPAAKPRIRAIDRFLSVSTVSWRNYQQIRSLEPFDSIGNHPPIICVPNVRVTMNPLGESGLTLKGIAEDAEGQTCVIIAFRNRRLAAAPRNMKAHVVGELVASNFAGRPVLQILVHDLIPAS